MTIIKAFVGHSFTKDDEALNNTFLSYLDQIKGMGIGFTWDHAKAAEPRELAEKVMNLIQDKNLFFGICTRKERVIDPPALKPCWVFSNKVGADETKFQWKTSDWIIQEIGMAVGRKMSLILLIEEGTRRPGGLQGNIEYIDFNRQNPERSFGKILEMIRALLPNVAKPSTQEISTTTAESEPQEQAKKEIEAAWSEPKPEWTDELYMRALARSIILNEPEAEEKINSAFLTSKVGQDSQNRVAWRALHEFLNLRYRDGKLAQLEALAKEHPDDGRVYDYLGRAYERYEEHAKAANAYTHAAMKTETLPVKHELLRKAAVAFRKAGMKPESEKIVGEMKQASLNDPTLEENLVRALREMAEIDTEMDAFYGLSERLLELRPDDNDIRFNLAYKYSQDGKDSLSMLQYLRIPDDNRGSVAWNNLGAQYDNFEITGLSVSCYRKAEQAGETIAMGNLAGKFIKVGFLSEAEEICIKAMKNPNFNKNVNFYMTRIREIPDEEAQKEDEIVKQAAYLSVFYRAYGRALCKPNASDHAGEWEGPKCRLNVLIQGFQFIAEGTYEIAQGFGLAAAIAAYSRSGFAPPEPAPKTEKRTITYIGRLSGHSIKAVMTEETVEDSGTGIAMPPTLLGGPDKSERAVLMIISESFDEIQVHDPKLPEGKRLYTLKRIKK